MENRKTIATLGIIAFLLYSITGFSKNQEINLFYPSPYGEYIELRSTRAAMGPEIMDANECKYNEDGSWNCPTVENNFSDNTVLLIGGHTAIGTEKAKSALDVAGGIIVGKDFAQDENTKPIEDGIRIQSLVIIGDKKGTGMNSDPRPALAIYTDNENEKFIEIGKDTGGDDYGMAIFQGNSELAWFTANTEKQIISVNSGANYTLDIAGHDNQKNQYATIIKAFDKPAVIATIALDGNDDFEDQRIGLYSTYVAVAARDIKYAIKWCNNKVGPGLIGVHNEKTPFIGTESEELSFLVKTLKTNILLTNDGIVMGQVIPNEINAMVEIIGDPSNTSQDIFYAHPSNIADHYVKINGEGKVEIGGSKTISPPSGGDHDIVLTVKGDIVANDLYLESLGQWLSESGGAKFKVIPRRPNCSPVGGDTGDTYCYCINCCEENEILLDCGDFMERSGVNSCSGEGALLPSESATYYCLA